MIKGKTSTGFTYEVNENILNDWRFTKTFAASSAKDDAAKVAAYTNMVMLLLGDETEERLCEHCKQDDGTIPTERIGEEVTEILNALGEKAKKS